MKKQYRYINGLTAENCRKGIEQQRRYLAFYLAHYRANNDERDRAYIGECFRMINAYTQALKTK